MSNSVNHPTGPEVQPSPTMRTGLHDRNRIFKMNQFTAFFRVNRISFYNYSRRTISAKGLLYLITIFMSVFVPLEFIWLLMTEMEAEPTIVTVLFQRLAKVKINYLILTFGYVCQTINLMNLLKANRIYSRQLSDLLNVYDLKEINDFEFCVMNVYQLSNLILFITCLFHAFFQELTILIIILVSLSISLSVAAFLLMTVYYKIPMADAEGLENIFNPNWISYYVWQTCNIMYLLMLISSCFIKSESEFVKNFFILATARMPYKICGIGNIVYLSLCNSKYSTLFFYLEELNEEYQESLTELPENFDDADDIHVLQRSTPEILSDYFGCHILILFENLISIWSLLTATAVAGILVGFKFKMFLIIFSSFNFSAAGMFLIIGYLVCKTSNSINLKSSWTDRFVGVSHQNRILITVLLFMQLILVVSAQPSAKCIPSGFLLNQGKLCPKENADEPCCVRNQRYPTFNCSPNESFKLTLNDFSNDGDGGGPAYCDDQYHSNKEKVVALFTGLFQNKKMCGRKIHITHDKQTFVEAKVIDECDSMMGCDEDHAYQPPCDNNIIDASRAVWKSLKLDPALGVVDIYINVLEFQTQSPSGSPVPVSDGLAPDSRYDKWIRKPCWYKVSLIVTISISSLIILGLLIYACKRFLPDFMKKRTKDIYSLKNYVKPSLGKRNLDKEDHYSSIRSTSYYRG